MTDNTTPSKLESKKIFLKDVSFESPGAPYIFAKTQSLPPIDVQISLSDSRLQEDQDFYEVVLKVTVTAKFKDKEDETKDEVAFLVEVEQAGVFLLQHPEADKIEIMKQVTCPHILLPFAREEINSLVSKGGFQQLLLSPINFEALYLQKKQREKAAEADETGRPN